MLHSRDRFEQWLPALFDGEFQWDFLQPAFTPTKIMPMDFDAVIERNGKRLIFETKAAGKRIDLGQAITLTNEWKLGAAIYHLQGKDPKSISGAAYYLPWQYGRAQEKIGDRDLLSCDAYDVLFEARRWFCWASDIQIPSREAWDNELWKWDYQRFLPTAEA